MHDLGDRPRGAMIEDFATLPGLVVLVPLLAAGAVALLPAAKFAAWLVIAASLATFALACALPWQPRGNAWVSADPLAAHMTLLTSFVGFTSALVSHGYYAAEGWATMERPRYYHALFLILLGAMLLALLANSLLLTWIASVAAVLALGAALALARTTAAVAASRNLLIVCGTGLALALFGTLVLYAGALPVLGPGTGAICWSTLAEAAAHMRPAPLNLAFAFLLTGYGTLAALAPLHGWFADAQAEGPAPLTAILAGSLLNVALTVILRTRSLLAANAGAIAPGPALLALGLVSVLLAGFALLRQRDVARCFAVSTVGQSGVAAFAFGLGGPAAVFAGLLHITLHTLANTAVLHCIARLRQFSGQRVRDTAGLLVNHRALALTLAAGIAALAGLPPAGLFTSLFLIVMETVRRLPLLAVPLVLALTVNAWALAARLIGLCAGAPTPDRGPVSVPAALLPAWLHLAVAAVLGLAMPGAVVAWFATVAESIK